MKRIVTLLVFGMIAINISFAGSGIDPVLRKSKLVTKFHVSHNEQVEKVEMNNVVMVAFEIGEDGSAQNIEIEEGVSEVLDQKALQVVCDMSKEHLYQNGFFEGTRFIIPVKITVQ